MQLLHLTLNKQWFELYLEQKKDRDYREVKPYWDARLIDKATGKLKKFDKVVMKNGYRDDARIFSSAHIDTRIVDGSTFIPANGEPLEPGKMYYEIRIKPVDHYYCKFCADPDHFGLFPYYGERPHSHKADGTKVFQNPVPENFQFDLSSTGLGVYTHCLSCGSGERPLINRHIYGIGYRFRAPCITMDRTVYDCEVLGLEKLTRPKSDVRYLVKTSSEKNPRVFLWGRQIPKHNAFNTGYSFYGKPFENDEKKYSFNILSLAERKPEDYEAKYKVEVVGIRPGITYLYESQILKCLACDSGKIGDTNE